METKHKVKIILVSSIVLVLVFGLYFTLYKTKYQASDLGRISDEKKIKCKDQSDALKAAASGFISGAMNATPTAGGPTGAVNKDEENATAQNGKDIVLPDDVRGKLIDGDDATKREALLGLILPIANTIFQPAYEYMSSTAAAQSLAMKDFLFDEAADTYGNATTGQIPGQVFINQALTYKHNFILDANNFDSFFGWMAVKINVSVENWATPFTFSYSKCEAPFVPGKYAGSISAVGYINSIKVESPFIQGQSDARLPEDQWMELLPNDKIMVFQSNVPVSGSFAAPPKK